jgi:hypothetical protein
MSRTTAFPHPLARSEESRSAVAAQPVVGTQLALDPFPLARVPAVRGLDTDPPTAIVQEALVGAQLGFDACSQARLFPSGTFGLGIDGPPQDGYARVEAIVAGRC